MTKTLEQYFAEWEAAVFGYGYGSGEEHVFVALKAFLHLCPNKGSYDFIELERAISPELTWLLINILARAGIIEYGSSARYAWLTPQGLALKSFVANRDVETLAKLIVDNDQQDEDESPKGTNPFLR